MAEKRSPNEARRAKKAKKPVFKLDLGLDLGLELDFDADDFDLIDDSKPRDRGKPQRDVRILKPSLDASGLFERATYENAEAFARQIDLTPGSRTYAMVSGSFVFGDVVEALITARNVGVKRLYICSLSYNQENVDSLKNVMMLMGDALERVVLVFSAFQYSHQKYGMVPYLYRELDDEKNRVQIVFGRWHAKIITMETVLGHTITIHGSANLCSSNCIEQIATEIDNRELHDFNAGLMDRVAERFGTINHEAEYSRLRAMPQKEAWELTEGG